MERRGWVAFCLMPALVAIPSAITRILLSMLFSLCLKDMKQDRKHTPAEGEQARHTRTM